MCFQSYICPVVVAEWAGAIFITDAEAEGQTQQEMNLGCTYTDRHHSPCQRRRDIMAAHNLMYIQFLYIKSNLADVHTSKGNFICMYCNINICYILLLKADPGAKMVLATFALISCRGWPLCNWPHEAGCSPGAAGCEQAVEVDEGLGRCRMCGGSRLPC